MRTSSSTGTFFNILLVRLRFIFVFIVVGLIVGNWSWIMNVVDRWTRPGEAEVQVVGDVEWFCPMHPSVVRQDAKEKCPICGMPLSKRKRGEPVQLPLGVLSRLQLAPFRIAQAGVATDEIRYRLLAREIRTVGEMHVDERHIAHLSARIAGRADELYITFAGAKIQKGDPVYKLYSPELVTTQEEYLLAREALEKLKAQPSPDPAALERAEGLVRSGRDRLLLWGISEEQVRRLETEKKAEIHIVITSPISGVVVEKDIHAGHYVEVGEDPYTVADLTDLWMHAEVFERDIGLVQVGQEVEIRTEAYPGELFTGKVSFINTLVDPQTRTVKVRVEVPNPEEKLKPGMWVSAALQIPLGKRAEVYWGCCQKCPDSKSEAPGSCKVCGTSLVRQGGVAPEPPPAQEGKKYVYRCTMDDGVRDTPGPCPKCGMMLDERYRVEVEQAVERKIYVCEMHPDEVFDAPGECRKDPCNGMELAERKIQPGSKLIYACPTHPDVTSDRPGTCPTDGKKLEYRIVSAKSELGEGWSCSLHPQETAAGKAHCHTCGMDMKHYEYERLLAVPFAAVIDSGVRKIVFVDRGHGMFDAVAVKLGPRAGEYYQAVEGLAEGDRVVTAGAFLLDAEARLNPAAGAQYFGASGQEAKK